jgi:hypothetical protein
VFDGTGSAPQQQFPNVGTTPAVAGSEWRETGMVFTAHKGDTTGTAKYAPRALPAARPGVASQHPLSRFASLGCHHSEDGRIPGKVILKLLGQASVRATREIYMHLTPART